MRVVLALVVTTSAICWSSGVAQDAIRAVDSTEILVTARPIDSIRSDRERIGRFRGEADARYGNARSRVAELEIQVELFEKQIDLVSTRIKLAKKEKREADKTVAEVEKKDLERRKGLLEKRLDLRRAEVDLAQAETAYAEAATRALDFEHQLERKRVEMAERGFLLELERKTLESKLDQENSRRSLVDRRARLVERQLALMQAQVNFTKR